MRTPGGGVDEEDAGDPRSVDDVLPGRLTGRTLAIIQTVDVVVREPLEREDDYYRQNRRHGEGPLQGLRLHGGGDYQPCRGRAPEGVSG